MWMRRASRGRLAFPVSEVEVWGCVVEKVAAAWGAVGVG
jgi:hypothetical protein